MVKNSPFWEWKLIELPFPHSRISKSLRQVWLDYHIYAQSCADWFDVLETAVINLKVACALILMAVKKMLEFRWTTEMGVKERQWFHWHLYCNMHVCGINHSMCLLFFLTPTMFIFEKKSSNKVFKLILCYDGLKVLSSIQFPYATLLSVCTVLFWPSAVVLCTGKCPDPVAVLQLQGLLHCPPTVL